MYHPGGFKKKRWFYVEDNLKYCHCLANKCDSEWTGRTLWRFMSFFPLFSSPPLERWGLRMIPKHSYVSHLLRYQPWTLDGELLETVKNFQKHSLNLTYFCHHHHIVNNEEINFLPTEKNISLSILNNRLGKLGLADIRSSAILAVSCPIVQRQLYSEVIYVLPGEAWRRFYPSATWI